MGNMLIGALIGFIFYPIGKAGLAKLLELINK